MPISAAIPALPADLASAPDEQDLPPDAFAALLAGVALPTPPAPLLSQPAAPTPPTDLAPAAWSLTTSRLAAPCATPEVHGTSDATRGRPQGLTVSDVARPAAGSVPAPASATPFDEAAPAGSPEASRPTPGRPTPIDSAVPGEEPPAEAVTAATTTPPAWGPVATAPPVAVDGTADKSSTPPVDATPTTGVRGRSAEHASTTGLAHRHAELARPEQATELTVRPTDVVAAPAPLDTPATTGAPRTESSHRVQPAILEAARHLRHSGDRTSLVVRLDPPELGAVLVRLTVRDGQVDVTLRTPDLAARSDLQAQSFDVQQVLREQGLDLASFDVAHGDVFAGTERDERDTPERATPRNRHTADGDANVTDDVVRPQPAGTWL